MYDDFKIKKLDSHSSENKITNGEVIKICFKKTDKVFRPVDKITRSLFFKNVDINSAYELNIGTASKKANAYIAISGHPDIKLNIFDYCVYSAVSTLYECGNEIITIKSIYDIFNYKYKNCISKISYSEILNSLVKMMGVTIKLNLEDEEVIHNRDFSFLRDANIVKKDNFYSDLAQNPFSEADKEVQYIFQLISGIIETNNTYSIKGVNVSSAIKLYDLPALYKISKYKKQIKTYTKKELDLVSSFKPKNLIIQTYLLDRIISFENRSSNKKTYIYKNDIDDESTHLNTEIENYNLIKFEGVYSAVNSFLGELSIKQKLSIRKEIENILSNFKDRNIISNYEYVIGRNNKKENILFYL